MKKIKYAFFSLFLFLIVILPAFAENYEFDSNWEYADFSAIHSGHSVMYTASGDKKNFVVAVNAGHGTSGVGSVRTFCHPDKSPKLVSGSTAAGETYSVAISSGMEFQDGTPEGTVTLAVAEKLKTKLLEQGYDVLMIRDGSDVQLDNVARTLMANNYADIHIAIHFDSSTSDKGAFYMAVPNVSSYRNMEPVKSHWQSHQALGDALIAGLQSVGVKIFSSGSMEMDLTQTSFSTIPSVDIELGDKVSDHSDAALDKLAEGLFNGIVAYQGGEVSSSNHTTPSHVDNENPSDQESGNGSSSGGGAAPDVDLNWETGDPLTPPSAATDGCEGVIKGDFKIFLQDVFTLLKFAAPLLVIVLSTIDYVKAIANQNADEIKKANSRFVKRLIAGIAIFLLPFILNLLFEMFGLYGLDTCGIS